MNVGTVQQSLNNTVQVIKVQLEYLLDYLYKTATIIWVKFGEIISNWNPSSWIEFTGLQWTLLKVLLILFVATIGFIAYSWQVYGKVITEKFVRPSTLKEVEELKLSVAKLKLPKEHSPRI